VADEKAHRLGAQMPVVMPVLKPADFLSFLPLFSEKVPLFLSKRPKFFKNRALNAQRCTNKGCEKPKYASTMRHNIVTLHHQSI
jgi:hypothetical protein